MFKRGGPSFQAQGTGITSPYDTPRTIGGGAIRGNPMGSRTGFKDSTLEGLEEIDIERQEIWEPKKGEWLDDVIGSLGAYSKAYKDSGEAKTIGEMGAEQAEGLKALRAEREEKRQLAALTGLESREAKLTRENEQTFEWEKMLEGFQHDKGIQKYDRETQVQIANLAKQNTATGQKLQRNDDKLQRKLKEASSLPHPQDKAAAAAAHKEHEATEDGIVQGINLKAKAIDIAGVIMKNDPTGMKTMDEIVVEVMLLLKLLMKQGFSSGGRVGYQMGTPDTGAMPIQASATETIDTPNADFTETETVTEGQQASVQMPYQEFRAALPAEVSDEIVQLIYYNQDAFADFAQISTQADVYAFNNKYGVSLVLPMDTETT